MRMRFTRHARNRMRRDGIPDDDVRRCMEEPERTEPSIGGRTNYIRAYREAELRVAAIEERGEFVIVTVTYSD